MTTGTPGKRISSKTASHLLVSNVPTVSATMTVADIEKKLIKETVNFSTINYIYILDSGSRLAGILSIKEIFQADKSKAVSELKAEKVFSVHEHNHQERIAHLALKHDLKAVPVVDKDNVFLGVVPYDTILKILHHETTEDMLRLGGVTHTTAYDDIFKLPLLASLRHRIPWLIVGLLGGMMVAGIVGQFEEVLSKNLILAAFIPLIVYMADAVGTQMEAFIIRDLAINPQLDFVKYILRQMAIVFVIGLNISLVLYLLSNLLYHLPQISLVLGLALFFAIFTSLLTGLIIPYVFSKLRLDPANASGPIATIIQDLLSILVYFLVASLLL